MPSTHIQKAFKQLMTVSGLFMLVLIGLPTQLMAQGTNPLEGQDSLVLENDRIEDVVDSEKPFLKPPYQEIKQGSKEEIKFESRAYYVETDFEPAPPEIQPVTLPDESPEFNNLLRLGIGRYTTPLADLYLTNGPDNTLDAGLEFHHLSAHNDVIPLRRFRKDYGTLRAGYNNGVNDLNGYFHLYNTAYFYYAGDDSTLVPLESAQREDSLRMTLTKVDIGVSAATVYDPDLPYYYDVGANIRFYGDRNTNREFHIDLRPTGGLQFSEEAALGADTRLLFVNGTIGEVDQNRTFFNLAPAFHYQTDRLKAKVGLQYAFFGNNMDSSARRTNLAPDLELTYAIVPGALSAFVGYNGSMDPNTYYNMIERNPYLAPDVRIEPTVTRVNVYGGIKGNVNQTVDFSAKAYYQRRQNQLIYRTRDNIYFEAVYDSLTTVTGVHAEVNYDLNDELKLGGALSINGYSTTNQDSLTPRFFYATPIRGDLFASYTFQEKLTSRAKAVIYGPTAINTTASGEIVRRNPFLNLSIGADFSPVERVSIFVEIDNLLNASYQRWVNYPERGIDFRGGITVAF